MFFQRVLAPSFAVIRCIQLSLISLVVVLPLVSMSQGVAGDDSLLEVEALYDKFGEEEQVKKQRQRKKRTKTKSGRASEPEDESVKKLSELSTLATFEDLAVIQKRFLPKSGRFELNTSLTNSINNQFFNNYGFEFRGAYYFTEKWAVEAMFSLLFESNRDITDNLVDKQRIDTRSLVVPENYFGIGIKWSPIYGKIALMNDDIVPFDSYFILGGGMSKTAVGESEPTISLGFGQLFAYSKKIAFRWDFTFNSYTATVDENLSTGGTQQTDLNQFDLFLSAGVSFFFPEATYR